MSILIKGVGMPKSCSECPCEYDTMLCMALEQLGEPFVFYGKGSPKGYFDDLEMRLPNCPLVEVKTPHGRLIDQEAMMQTDPLGYIDYCDSEERIASILHQVLAEDAEIPFVIEAED